MGPAAGRGRHQRGAEQEGRVCVSTVSDCVPCRAGEKAVANVRGKANAEKVKCKEKLKPSQIDFFASDLTEISVQIVIDKVLMYCSVDGDTKGDKSPFSLAAFNEACPASQT